MYKADGRTIVISLVHKPGESDLYTYLKTPTTMHRRMVMRKGRNFIRYDSSA